MSKNNNKEKPLFIKLLVITLISYFFSQITNNQTLKEFTELLLIVAGISVLIFIASLLLEYYRHLYYLKKKERFEENHLEVSSSHREK